MCVNILQDLKSPSPLHFPKLDLFPTPPPSPRSPPPAPLVTKIPKQNLRLRTPVFSVRPTDSSFRRDKVCHHIPSNVNPRALIIIFYESQTAQCRIVSTQRVGAQHTLCPRLLIPPPLPTNISSLGRIPLTISSIMHDRKIKVSVKPTDTYSIVCCCCALPLLHLVALFVATYADYEQQN